MTRQLTLFSAGTRAAGADDLEGLLAGPGQLVVRDGRARLSVPVAEPWRAAALVEELAPLGLTAEVVAAQGDGVVVRTGFTGPLHALARRWTGGAVKRPPPGFMLDGSRLRWWCIAAGRPAAAGYTLGLGPSDEPAWSGVGAALAAVGLPGVFVGPRGDGPAFRLPGRRRVARLRELVGDPPAQLPPGIWPDEEPPPRPQPG